MLDFGQQRWTRPPHHRRHGLSAAARPSSLPRASPSPFPLPLWRRPPVTGRAVDSTRRTRRHLSRPSLRPTQRLTAVARPPRRTGTTLLGRRPPAHIPAGAGVHPLLYRLGTPG